MENREETTRLEIKTDTETVKQQAMWCGLKPGMRVLDAGCGPGKTTSSLYEMIQPGGAIVGVDNSEKRISYANQHYANGEDISFHVHDLRNPLEGFGQFDIIWVRFLLEYYRQGSMDIVENLKDCLNPGGYLCLIDLDCNCLGHYALPPGIQDILFELSRVVDEKYNFDTYAGRKLYSYLYDSGFEDIEVSLTAHHLIYGNNLRDADIFNWTKKMEMAAHLLGDVFDKYPGGYEAFSADFHTFFLDPRRFTYTPLVLCKGRTPITN